MHSRSERHAVNEELTFMISASTALAGLTETAPGRRRGGHTDAQIPINASHTGVIANSATIASNPPNNMNF